MLSGKYITKFDMVSMECRPFENRKNGNTFLHIFCIAFICDTEYIYNIFLGHRIGECVRDVIIVEMASRGFLFHECDNTDCHFAKSEELLVKAKSLFGIAHTGKAEGKYCTRRGGGGSGKVRLGKNRVVLGMQRN